MCEDHDRFFVMLIPRNINLFHLGSTDVDRGCFCLVWFGVLNGVLFLV